MLFGKKEEVLFSPATGECIPQSKIPDEAFSSGMLGTGFGVVPDTGEICAPVGGRVESVAEGKHAYAILDDAGLDILVHIGVDTVTLGGDGFCPLVKAGDRVRAGDPLCRVDLEKIRGKELCTAIAVLITNAERIRNIEYTYGACTAGTHPAMRFRLERKG